MIESELLLVPVLLAAALRLRSIPVAAACIPAAIGAVFLALHKANVADASPAHYVAAASAALVAIVAGFRLAFLSMEATREGVL